MLYTAESPQYIFDLAMSYARTIESTIGKAHGALLDQLDRAMQAKIYAIRYESFVALAAQHGLCAYLREKLAQDGQCLHPQGRRPVLDCALSCPHDLALPEHPEAIGILLKNGADQTNNTMTVPRG